MKSFSKRIECVVARELDDDMYEWTLVSTRVRSMPVQPDVEVCDECAVSYEVCDVHVCK